MTRYAKILNIVTILNKVVVSHIKAKQTMSCCRVEWKYCYKVTVLQNITKINVYLQLFLHVIVREFYFVGFIYVSSTHTHTHAHTHTRTRKT
jgi:hypothetical protein